MKVSFSILSLLILLTPFSDAKPARPPQSDFSLDVTIVTGEHSRDSNSVTAILTVSSGALVYEQTFAGARSGRRQPVKKEFKLGKEDQAALIGLLNKGNLMVFRTISEPPQQKGSSRYFELSIHSRLGGKESTVSIDASPHAANLKTDSLYRASVRVIEELYKIINRTDPDITMPQLIN